MKLMTERVIIIGGGAKKLSDNKHSEVNVVDRNNYHFFPTLLYQVSAAFIEPSNNGKCSVKLISFYNSQIKNYEMSPDVYSRDEFPVCRQVGMWPKSNKK